MLTTSLFTRSLFRYYNIHHHFLSDRSVFVVMWKMTDGPDSVRFWFESLKAHLPAYVQGGECSISIIVVGTHVDILGEKPLPCRHPSLITKEDRNHAIKMIASESGLTHPFTLHEISCLTMEGFAVLEEDIYSSCLGQSHMGKVEPEAYVKIAHVMSEIRLEKRGLCE